MVRKAGKHQKVNKQAKIYVGRPLTLHTFCFLLMTMHELDNRNASIG